MNIIRLSGLLAARPAASSAQGARFYATDVPQVYVSYGSQWLAQNALDNSDVVGFLSGANLAARPSIPANYLGYLWSDAATGNQYEAFPTAWALVGDLTPPISDFDIGALPSASSVGDNDLVPIEQSGTQKKALKSLFGGGGGVVDGQQIFDGSHVLSLDAGLRELVGGNGTTVVLDWSSPTELDIHCDLYIEGNIFNWTDSLANIDLTNRKLYASDGTTVMVDWSGTNPSYPLQFMDGQFSLDANGSIVSPIIVGGEGNNAATFGNRTLYASDGTTVMLDWVGSGPPEWVTSGSLPIRFGSGGMAAPTDLAGAGFEGAAGMSVDVLVNAWSDSALNIDLIHRKLYASDGTTCQIRYPTANVIEFVIDPDDASQASIYNDGTYEAGHTNFYVDGIRNNYGDANANIDLLNRKLFRNGSDTAMLSWTNDQLRGFVDSTNTSGTWSFAVDQDNSTQANLYIDGLRNFQGEGGANIDLFNRTFNATEGGPVLAYGVPGQVSVKSLKAWDSGYGQLIDGNGIESTDWSNRFLKDSDGTTVVATWGGFNGVRLFDPTGSLAFHSGSRQLLNPDGTTVAIDYGTNGSVVFFDYSGGSVAADGSWSFGYLSGSSGGEATSLASNGSPTQAFDLNVPKMTFGVVGGTKILLVGLPTSDPAVSYQLWNNAGTLKISAGP